MDEGVEAGEFLVENFIDVLGGALGFGKVGVDRQALSPLPLDRFDHLLCLLGTSAKGDGDIESTVGQLERDGPTHALGSSSHQGYFGSCHGVSLSDQPAGGDNGR